VAKSKGFEVMIADLIHHREANQNGGAPLIIRADMPKLRLIEHKRMGFLKGIYRIFKDSVTPKDKVNVDIICISMKSWVRHYHALLPQLD
jgi:hypothetical protein